MHLNTALNTATSELNELRDALTDALTRAHEEQTALRSFDAEAVLQALSRRESSQGTLNTLMTSLASTLSATARGLGVSELTVETLRGRGGEEAERFLQALARVREVASALRAVDQLNQSLAARTLSCVRAYTRGVGDQPATYDRRGAHTRDTAAIVSRRA